jgi:hypothetical protein
MSGDVIRTIADELAIRRVLGETWLRLEMNQFEERLGLFTDDTVFDVFGRSLPGRVEVSAMLP